MANLAPLREGYHSVGRLGLQKLSLLEHAVNNSDKHLGEASGLILRDS